MWSPGQGALYAESICFCVTDGRCAMRVFEPPLPGSPERKWRLLLLGVFSRHVHTAACTSNGILFKTIIIIMCPCMGEAHMPCIHMDNFLESGLTSHVYMGCRGQTHEARLGQRLLCP